MRRRRGRRKGSDVRGREKKEGRVVEEAKECRS